MAQTKVTTSDISSNTEPLSIPASSGYVLTADGAGNTAWTAGGEGGAITGSGTVDEYAYFTSSGVITSDSVLSVVPGTLVQINGGLNITGRVKVIGTSSPGPSPAGSGFLYFDSGTNAFQVSENGGAITGLITGSGASGQVPYFDASADLTSSTGMTYASTYSNFVVGNLGGVPVGSGGGTYSSIEAQGANGAVFAANQFASSPDNVNVGLAGFVGGGSHGSPLATPTGYDLVSMVGFGYDGATFFSGVDGAGGELRMIVAPGTSIWSSTDHGTDLKLDLSPSGSTTHTDNVFYVTSTPNPSVGIGKVPTSTSYALDVVGSVNISTGSNYYIDGVAISGGVPTYNVIDESGTPYVSGTVLQNISAYLQFTSLSVTFNGGSASAQFIVSAFSDFSSSTIWGEVVIPGGYPGACLPYTFQITGVVPAGYYYKVVGVSGSTINYGGMNYVTV